MPIPVPSASGLSCRIERKGDLFPGFLHRLPNGHLVDRCPKGRHELLGHPEGGQRPQKSQLPSDLRRDPLVGIKPQQHPGDRELMAATRTLNLHLPKRHPGEGRQNLRRLAAPGLPDEPFDVATRPTGEGLLSPGHQKLSVSNQRLLQKVGQKLRKKNRECRHQGRQLGVRQTQTKLTRKIDFEIFFLWGHSHTPFLGW